MDTANNQSINPNGNGQGKDKFHKVQIKTIFDYLHERVATASMVSAATGVPQKNICRYKRDLEKTGKLWEVEKKLCEHTGFRAWYLTTNPHKAPEAYNPHIKDISAHYNKFSEYEIAKRQRELILKCLSEGEPKTINMICRETRLWKPQAKRHVPYLTKKGLVVCVFMDTCPIRGKRAGFYSLVKTPKS